MVACRPGYSILLFQAQDIADEASSAYARAMGIAREAFLSRFGAPMPPRQFASDRITVVFAAVHESASLIGRSGSNAFQAVDVTRGLVPLSGIGTLALPSWDSKTRWNDLSGDLADSCRQGTASPPFDPDQCAGGRD